MDELIGPVIGITLVLMSVFIPAAFLPGLTGQLYRQFALVIAATAFISAINAVTLKPTQCALWLRPPTPPEKRNFFYRGFNAVYGVAERGYVRLIGAMTRRSGAMVVLALASGRRRDLGADARADRFPAERGPGLSDRQRATARRRLEGAHRRGHATDLDDREGDARRRSCGHRQRHFHPRQPASLANAGVAFVVLKDWDVRLKEKGQDLLSIYQRLNGALQGVPQAIAFALLPPPIQGIGNVGGFTHAGRDQERRFRLRAVAEPGQHRGQGRQRAIRAAEARHDLPGRRAAVRGHRRPHQGRDARHHGRHRSSPPCPAMSDRATSTQFNKFGHVFQIYTQALPDYRANADDIRNLKVKAGNGTMTPIGTVVDVNEVQGPPLISLYNLYPSATVVGSAAPGFSSGQALDIMEQIGAQALPIGTGYEWTAMSYQEKAVGSQIYYVFGLALLLVYFVLAGQYESWILPLAVLLAVPLALLGTVGALTASRRRQQSLHADRPHPPDRARQQECDPDRRICARATRARAWTILDAAVEAARLQVPADSDDVFRLHPGRAAACPRDRRRRRRAQIDRHRGVQRHDRLHLSRGLFVPSFYVVLQRFEERRRRAAAPGARPADARECRCALDVMNDSLRDLASLWGAKDHRILRAAPSNVG